MRFFLLFALLLSGVESAVAQFLTQRVTAENQREFFPADQSVFGVTTSLLKTRVVTPPNVAALLAEDDKQTAGPPRFGRAVDVTIDLINNGTWTDTKGGRVWSLAVESPAAKSLHFVFKQLSLPIGAKLYLYNEDRTMIMGPILAEHLQTSGAFSTDVLEGKKVFFELFEPIDVKGKSALQINQVYYGYKDSAGKSGFGSSGTCNTNVNCPAGNNWQTESNGVIVLLTNTNGNSAFCSASLLNNKCQNFTPNVLTAFHCLDADQNGTLSGAEQGAVGTWVFRFLYKSPTCSPTQNPNTYISYNGSAFLSAWQASDFALLRMNQRPASGTNIQYLGWTRSTSVPSGVIGLHHPQGDVMKISAGGSLQRTNGNVAFSPVTVPGSIHWVASWTQGITEPGSSGSPLFDSQTHRIIGQLSGGPSGCGKTDQRDAYGRFDASWDGGGTSATRLRDWLDPTSTGAVDVASAGIPSISGPTFFCTTAQFVLNSAPAGAPITWSVSPSSAVSPSSGSGATANVTRVSSADATITFLVGCNATQGFTYNFHAGDYSSSNYPVSGPGNAGCNQTVYYSTNQLPGATSYTWFWPSGWSYQSGQNTYSLAVTTNSSSGQVGVRVAACGGQGGSPSTIFTSVSGCFARMAVYPNPSSDVVQIEFDRTDVADLLPERLTLYSERSTKPVKTVNIKEFFDKKAFRDGNKVDIDVHDLPRGVYYIHLTSPKQKAGEVDRIRVILN